ncbi:adenylyltransferase/cytidyltransferase family protein [Agrobacterium sp. CG674]
MRDFHYGIYIGRFQPLHIGHEQIIRGALEKVETLILIVGSSHIARNPHNPFSYEERAEMLRSVFSHEIATGRIILTPLYDYEHDYDWAANLKKGVNEAILEHANKGGVRLHGLNDFKIALAGFGKDSSSYYLKMFPDWASIQVDAQHGTINASDIRYDYFRRLPRMPHDAVSDRILAWLKGFSLSEPFKDLVAWKHALQQEWTDYGKGPAMAGDALITWRGMILLVKRGKAIGKGQLAMPGGMVNDDERVYDASIRELREETSFSGIDLDEFYAGCLFNDRPNRSTRRRMYSMLYHFAIPDAIEVKQVVAGDDAAEAGWYFFEALSSSDFFEDHYDIIKSYLMGENN